MDRIRYAAHFFQESGDDAWLVEFPTLNGGTGGIVTFGDNRDHARTMARDALTGYLASRFERGFELEPAGALPKESGWEWVSPEPPVEVALLIRRMRETQGLSQQQAADLVGVPYTSYQRWEHPDKCNATLKTLDKVAQAFGKHLEVAFR